MFIANCQIKNYKGFRESEQINFTPGFNVVVGQNNAGKTALTEALSLQFQNRPHRSLSHRPVGASEIAFVVQVEPAEAFDYLRAIGTFLLPLNVNENQASACARVQRLIENAIKVSCQCSAQASPNSIQIAGQSSGFSNMWAKVKDDSNTITPSPPAGANHVTFETLGAVACSKLKQNIYIFHAERLTIYQSLSGINPVLAANAQNLPEVLHLLQSKNPERFSRFVKDVHTVFPDIQNITVTPINQQTVQINIWFVDPKTEREDLAIALSDCGTGIGQVLSMLYVVINSNEPRTILIDEPQSFLHPGAIRKLFEIFKRERNQKHQYIVTTHSPTVVTACSPCNVIMLHRKDNESKARMIDVCETAELRLFLSEIGARLSDVFGADKILWVEGRTEELCFPRIVEQLLKLELLATEIIGVTHVGDLATRQKKVVFEIYQKLCEGRGLLPPALGFCFDREKLSQKEMDDLHKDSHGLIQFIPRRMYENYLLNPKAIASILNEADTGKIADVTGEKVDEWLAANRLSPNYIQPSEHADWLTKADAAKLLNDLFNGLTEARVRYDKIKHGLKLTDWIIKNTPADFQELGDFLSKTLGASRTTG